MLTKDAIMKLANGSDVRGVAVEGVADEPVTLTAEAVNRIAGAFVEFLARRSGKKPGELKITIGHDARISAPMLMEAAVKGLRAKGAAVLDCGLASTPAMFMSIIFPETAADGAVMLTASHLPYNRNGMKFFTASGGLEHEDIHAILEMAATMEEGMADITGGVEYDLIERYALHLRGLICTKLSFPRGGKPLRGMHVVVDAGNGDGGFFVNRILKPLGANTEGSLFLEPDGMFPNHMPNPEDKAAMESLRNAVLASKADLGLIFDTDVDRMGAVLANGEEISRNSLIAMMASILAEEYPGSTIVTDSVTSDELTAFLEQKLGLKHHRYMRGYKNVINECIRLNHAGITSPLAIETSGHGALRENYYLDDGAYLAVRLLIAAALGQKEGHPLASRIARLRQPAESREYRLRIVGQEPYRAYGDKVLAAFDERARATGISIAEPSYEGIRLVFSDGWALLRMSLHDPNMPLNIESRSEGGCAVIAARVKSLLDGFDSLDLRSLET